MIFLNLIIFSLSVCIINAAVVTSPALKIYRKSSKPFRRGCKHVSFTQIQGDAFIFFHHTELQRCYSVDTRIPATVQLNALGCSYQVHGFSNYNCNDEVAVNKYPLNAFDSIVKINARKSVCSFRLANYVSSDGSVSVKFMYANRGNKIGVEFNIADAECYNLCKETSDSIHPSFVTIINKREQFVDIFSAPDCLHESIIQDRNGSALVANGTNLEMLTEPDAQNLTRSFLITRIKS